ncbi:MAG TPA: GNAT family N-acetyltransferase [Verrucomicrobiae bacterium]|nr:GNAT family N-acetyltransferase [Verrucomicrobiae bacterium]
MPDTAFTRLDTERLTVRRFRSDDLDSFVAYRADPDVARFQSWENFTRADGAAFIAEMLRQHPDTPGEWFQFAIELKSTGKMIGDCAQHVFADRRTEAEIGFSLASAYQGNGYAREALAGLLDYAFSVLKKSRIEALTDARNAKSIAVLERLGFMRDAAMREPVEYKGEICSEFLYLLTRDSWRAGS